jgi:HPt (histidine-containing phosphotransfer) domain-containing protein|tara:strand:- start:1122 stop:1400 length:279 start_codon:yes stop_codon:yes gene_type:complete
MANPISKASSLPAVSIGFALSIIVAVWIAGTRFRDFENADMQNSTQIEDVLDRQKKYIGTSGLLTERIDELEDLVNQLERDLALLKVQLDLN